MRAVGEEGLFVGRESFLEGGNIADSDSCTII